MASQFDADFADATADFLALYGEPILVTPLGKAQRTIMAVVLRESRASTGEFQGQNFYNDLRIQISSRNDTEGIIRPCELRNGGDFDVYVIDGVPWGTRRIEEKDIGGMHKLALFDGGQTV